MAITGIPHTEPTIAAQAPSEQKPATSNQKPAQSQLPNATVPTDTVQISTAAQTAFQESQETYVKTVQEASKGDQQALRLLAKEAVTKNG